MLIVFFLAQSAQGLNAFQVTELDAGHVGPLLERADLRPLVSDTGDMLFAGRARASVYDLSRNRFLGDENLFSGLRADHGRLVPFSVTVSQSSSAPKNGLFYSWENERKPSRTPHMQVLAAPDRETLLAAEGPFLTSATRHKPYFSCSIVHLARRAFPPNVDSGFWTRQREKVVCFGAKQLSKSSADFFLARKPSEASERWSLVRFSVKADQGAVMSSLGTFQGRDLNVIGWSPHTGRFVAHSPDGVTEYSQSGHALASYRGVFTRAVFTSQGLLLTGPNPHAPYPTDRTCLAQGGRMTNLDRGRLCGASASGRFVVFKREWWFVVLRIR